MSGDRYLGTRSTHIDGELEGISLALEALTKRRQAILSDCRPAIRVTEKLDSGTEGPRSSIEARIQRALEIRENRQQETYLTWVKGHKDIKGNEAADKLSKQASILGHESEGVVTPAGLRACARRERAKARGADCWGGAGKHCPPTLGAERTRGYRTSGCSGSTNRTQTNAVEACPELGQWRPRRAVWKEWKEALGGRAVSKKEAEEEGDLLGAFFYRVYEFLFSFSNPPPIVHRPCVPARYATISSLRLMFLLLSFHLSRISLTLLSDHLLFPLLPLLAGTGRTTRLHGSRQKNHTTTHAWKKT